MRRIKHLSVVLMLAVFVSLFAGCSRPQVPDIYGRSEEQAVKILKDAGFVPKVYYEYREKEEKGKVFKSNPGIEAVAKQGSEVVIYISKGPEKIIAKNAYSRWTTMGKNEDSWSFNLPYVDKDVLYIECVKVILKDGITWQKSEEDGISVAQASVTENFEKSFPVKVRYDKEYVAPFEEQSFVIEIPLEELEEELPELICVRLNVTKDETEEEEEGFIQVVPEGMEIEEEGIRVDFTVDW